MQVYVVRECLAMLLSRLNSSSCRHSWLQVCSRIHHVQQTLRSHERCSQPPSNYATHLLPRELTFCFNLLQDSFILSGASPSILPSPENPSCREVIMISINRDFPKSISFLGQESEKLHVDHLRLMYVRTYLGFLWEAVYH